MNYVWKCIGIACLIALAIVGFGFIVMGLWNWLIPDVFSGPRISFGEALGLLVLSKILFGGFRGGMGKHHGCHCGRKRSHWKARMEAKMANMSPEEKEKFKNKMYKCGWNSESKEGISEPS
jgi:hypothetical protein